MNNKLWEQWFPNVRNDLLAGLVVALALIPEAIATLVDRFAIHDKLEAAKQFMRGH